MDKISLLLLKMSEVVCDVGGKQVVDGPCIRQVVTQHDLQALHTAN